MGGSVSCCISPGDSPKLRRREVELEEWPITATEDVSEDTGTYLQHISDRELPDVTIHCDLQLSYCYDNCG
uniref:Uncharacterized protein n=1 Tax=Mola mola TaxID=94237 RepID=A0A3Q3XN83_MOLML